MVNPVDIYIESQSAEAQPLLQQIRELVQELATDATEIISYGMPAFKLNGRILIYYAGHSHHIGLYPSGSGIPQFNTRFDLLGLKWSKGAVQLPLHRPLPSELLRELILFRIEQNRQRPAPGYKLRCQR